MFRTLTETLHDNEPLATDERVALAIVSVLSLVAALFFLDTTFDFDYATETAFKALVAGASFPLLTAICAYTAVLTGLGVLHAPVAAQD